MVVHRHHAQTREAQTREQYGLGTLVGKLGGTTTVVTETSNTFYTSAAAGGAGSFAIPQSAAVGTQQASPAHYNAPPSKSPCYVLL